MNLFEQFIPYGHPSKLYKYGGICFYVHKKIVCDQATQKVNIYFEWNARICWKSSSSLMIEMEDLDDTTNIHFLRHRCYYPLMILQALKEINDEPV